MLDTACDELAFALPWQAQGCAGQPPVQAHPEGLGQPRPFQPHLEFALFDLRRVDRDLAQFTWLRKVGQTGQSCIGGHHCYDSVGRRYAQHWVHVRFDPADRHFLFFLDEQPDQEIGRRPAHGLTVAEITGLTPDAPHFVWQQLPLDLVFPEG